MKKKFAFCVRIGCKGVNAINNYYHCGMITLISINHYVQKLHFSSPSSRKFCFKLIKKTTNKLSTQKSHKIFMVIFWLIIIESVIFRAAFLFENVITCAF